MNKMFSYYELKNTKYDESTDLLNDSEYRLF